MVSAGSSVFTLSDRPPLGPGGPETGPIVVWLWGEHDASTDTALCLTLARAIAVDSPGLVLDLSEVDFIGPSTLAIIVRAREFLRERSASLTLRSPSAVARDIIDACGLADLLGPDPEMAGTQRGTALSSWVAVPVADRSDGQPAGPVPVPERVLTRVDRTIDLRAHAVSA
jgi:anti-anti-sigma factor